MTYKMIRLKPSTGELVDSLVTRYEYKSTNDCILDMVSFFIENGLRPDTNLNLNIHKEIQTLREEFKKRDDSFRKWFGEISNKKIVEIIKQNEFLILEVGGISSVVKGNAIEQITEKLSKEKSKDEEPVQQQNIVKSDNEITNKESYFKVLADKDIKIKDLKDKLRIIANKAKKNEGFRTSYNVVLNEMEYNLIKDI